MTVDNEKFVYDFPRPSLAATICIYDTSKKKFLIIKRGENPQKGKWGFTGGFMECYYPGKSKGENIKQAAIREIKEETSLSFNINDLRLIDIRSDPHRDPERIHVVDVGFFIQGSHLKASPGDDVEKIKWVTKEELNKASLAFDHKEIWKK